MPLMPGRPRSKTTASGWCLAASSEGVFAGGGGVGLVAAGAQVGGERPQDRRFVVDDEHPGGSRCGLQLDDHGGAAAGGVFDGELAAAWRG